MLNSVRWMCTSQRNFSNYFCLDFMWRYILFYHRLQSAPNVHLQIPQKVCFQTAQSKERFNSVRWTPTSQRCFSEFFCLVFMWRYTLFHHRPQSDRNVQFRFYKKRLSKLLNQKKGLTLWGEYTYCKEVSQIASVWVLCEDISFSTLSRKALQMSTCRFYRKSVPNRSIKRKVQLRDTNAHIKNKLLRIFLSSFYVMIFPFPT